MTAAEVADELPTALYRLYDADGALLYVGVTGDLRTRFAQHAAGKPWWPEVARKTVEWHETRIAALGAEAAAMENERPRYNILETSTRARAGKPGDRHRTPLVGWRPPAELADWARAESEREGRRLGDLLTEALEEYRARRS